MFFASLIGYLFRFLGFPETNIVIVYLLAVQIIAWLFHGLLYGITGSLIATFTFNFFFTDPYYTFTVNDPSYIITFIIMTIIAVITSMLTSHARQSAFSAKEKEAETRALYELTNDVTEAKGVDQIASLSIKAISVFFDCQAAILYFDSNHTELNYVQYVNVEHQTRRKVDDIEKLAERLKNLQTLYIEGKDFFDFPIRGQERTLGAIRLPKHISINKDQNKLKLLLSMIESTALAMDRFNYFEQRFKDREEATQERYRSTLLRSISHDLRTPLASIIGTAEMLKSMTDKEDDRFTFLENIYERSNWLHALVENILHLTKIQEGKLNIKKQPEAVEEVIGSAINRVVNMKENRLIKVNIPEQILFVPMDAKLIEQVIFNLLMNAIKHTSVKKEITVSVEVNDTYALFIIMDQGEGISPDDLPYIFQMFYTVNTNKGIDDKGIGLGLSICQTIVEAHGGVIEARNRIDCRGALFVFKLPLEVNEDG